MNRPTSHPSPALAFAGDYPDPSILRVNEDYYATHSNFNWAPGLLIWHSRDLTNWRPLTYALPDHCGDIWAPELIHHAGRFYLYYFAAGPNAGNYVVTAERIEGPWSKPLKLDLGGIDPGHAVGPDGQRYLHVSGGQVAEIDADGTRVTGALRKCYDGWPIPADWRIETFALEGPKIFRRGGWYYLVSAEGGTAGPATAHMVVVARSKSPTGPWDNSPHNPLVHTACRGELWHCTGHGTIFDTPDGRWLVMYHGYRKGYVTLGRQTLIAPVTWTEDGWPVLAIDQPAPASAVAPDLCEDFSADALKWIWRFWGEHDRARYRVGGGRLILNCKGTSPGNCSPASVLCGHRAYSVSVRVRRLSASAEAALVLFYNEKAWIGLGFGQRGVGLASMSSPRPWQVAAAGAMELELKLVNDHHELDLLYRVPGGDWIDLKCSRETSGFHHNTFGGFLSLRPTLCAFGEGQVAFTQWTLEAIGT